MTAIEDENELVERAKTDPEAFGILYERYVDKIYSYIYYRTSNQEDAEDLTAKVFHKALGHIGTYKNRGHPFSAWLYRIATNEINRFYRKRKREPVFSVEKQDFRELLSFQPENDHTMERQIQQLLRLLEDLPTPMLEVLELRFIEGHSFKEIAFILNLSESGAKMRTYRALDSIRNIWDRKHQRKHG